MKLFLALLVLVGSYFYMLLHTTNIVLGQTQQLSHAYQTAGQTAADYAHQLSLGQKP